MVNTGIYHDQDDNWI